MDFNAVFDSYDRPTIRTRTTYGNKYYGILMLPYCCCVLVHRRRKQNFKIYFSQNAYHEFMTRTREGDASVNPLIAVEPAQNLKLHLVV